MTQSEQIDTTKKEDKKKEDKKDELRDDKGRPLSAQDIVMFTRYGRGPYHNSLKNVEDEIKTLNQKITTLCGIKDSDTGLALPAQWNIQQDMQMLK